MTSSAIHFIASPSDRAQAALETMTKRYGQGRLEDAEVIVALGGDGFMLRTLHRYIGQDKPIYGMKLGTVGFLMNAYEEDDLPDRLQAAKTVDLYPLRMTAETESGRSAEALAINEVSLLRQTNQAAHIRISINGQVRMEELICDGALVSTTAGSTAYNFSAHGPILPLGTEVLALTPISPFRPRRWRGAILPDTARVTFDVLNQYKRPVSATADAHEVRNVTRVEIAQTSDVCLHMMFDPDHSLEERIINEQFL